MGLPRFLWSSVASLSEVINLRSIIVVGNLIIALKTWKLLQQSRAHLAAAVHQKKSTWWCDSIPAVVLLRVPKDTVSHSEEWID